MSTTLIASLKAGRLSAFTPLAAPRLWLARRLAWKRLGPPATAEDADEVASSVLMSLFRVFTVHRGGEMYTRLTDTPSLLRAIAVMARQKARRWARRNLAALRDRRREVPLTVEPPARPTPDPPPDRAEWLADPRLSARQRAIVTARLEVGSWDEVAARLGVSRRTVFRELEAARRRVNG